MRRDYEILAPLGRGGQAHTWLARHLPSGQRVALKELRLGEVDHWKAVELFEREAQVLRSLQHPNIPAYLDFFREEEDNTLTFFLAQELIQGHSLQEELRLHGRWDEDRCRQALACLLHVLIYLHDRVPAVIHRDIKPSNILCGPQGRLYLIDFGAVQVHQGKTMLSTVVGTPGYMPMEQMIGQARPASDLYSLGVTLGQCLTGRPPTELALRGTRLDFAPHVEHDSPVLAVLERMVEPDLERRFPHARAALQALESSAEHEPEPPAPLTPGALDVATLDRLIYGKTVLNRAQPFPNLNAPGGFWSTLWGSRVLDRDPDPPLEHPWIQAAQEDGFSFLGRQTRYDMPDAVTREAWVDPRGEVYLLCDTGPGTVSDEDDPLQARIFLVSFLEDGRQIRQNREEDPTTQGRTWFVASTGDLSADLARHREALQERILAQPAAPLRQLDMNSLMALFDHAWFALPHPDQDDEDLEEHDQDLAHEAREGEDKPKEEGVSEVIWGLVALLIGLPLAVVVYPLMVLFQLPSYLARWKDGQKHALAPGQARRTLPAPQEAPSKAKARQKR